MSIKLCKIYNESAGNEEPPPLSRLERVALDKVWSQL